MTPAQPVSAPRFPIAESSATVRSGGWIERCFGGLGGLPRGIGVFEDTALGRAPRGAVQRVPAFGPNVGCARIVREQKVAVEAELTVNFRLEFALRRPSRLEVSHHPRHGFSGVVHLVEQQVDTPAQPAVSRDQLALNGDHPLLNPSPERSGDAFVREPFDADPPQQQVDAASMAVNRLFPAVVFPTTVARRGVEGVLFFVPAVFQEGLADLRKPPHAGLWSVADVHVEQVFDRRVNGRPKGSGHAGLPWQALTAQPIHSGTGLVPVPRGRGEPVCVRHARALRSGVMKPRPRSRKG